MINKRNFLKGGATALVAGHGVGAAVAAVPPSLHPISGEASWQAHVGRSFQVDGHTVVLQAVEALPRRQPGEQFSLQFTGSLPPGVGDQLHVLSGHHGVPVTLYLARTDLGLRADFCRLQP